MATVNKDFKIKSGLIVEGATGTINGENILTTSQASTDHIVNIVGGTTLVTSVESTQLEVINGELNVKSSVFDAYGDANIAESNAIATAAMDATSKADAAQSAATSAAETFATNADTVLYGTVTSDIATAKSEAGNIAQGYATTAENNASSYTNTAISDEVTNRNSAIDSAISTEVTNRNSAIATAKGEANGYTDTAIANLVDAAPEMLNTLNELAASLGDNADFIGTVNSAIGEKVAKAGDTMTGELVLFGAPTQGNAAATKTYVDGVATGAYNDAVATASDDATTKANTAESNSNTYTNNAIASGNSNASPVYKEVDITWATKNVGSYASIANIETAAIYAWSTNYASAKFIVRTRSGNHSQVSEILVTADINKNLATTEYGIVGTNGNIADITVDYDSVNNQYRLLATTTATGTEAIVSGTLMAYGD
jgi:hypothetical protein